MGLDFGFNNVFQHMALSLAVPTRPGGGGGGVCVCPWRFPRDRAAAAVVYVCVIGGFHAIGRRRRWYTCVCGRCSSYSMLIVHVVAITWPCRAVVVLLSCCCRAVVVLSGPGDDCVAIKSGIQVNWTVPYVDLCHRPSRRIYVNNVTCTATSTLFWVPFLATVFIAPFLHTPCYVSSGAHDPPTLHDSHMPCPPNADWCLQSDTAPGHFCRHRGARGHHRQRDQRGGSSAPLIPAPPPLDTINCVASTDSPSIPLQPCPARMVNGCDRFTRVLLTRRVRPHL